jgi:hypothetical protein
LNALGLLAIALGVGAIAILLLRRDRARTLGRVALLDAIEKAAHAGVSATDPAQVAEATLRPLTRAFSPADGLLALWTLDPPMEGRVEGFAAVRWASSGSIPPEMVRWLSSADGVALVDRLGERIVREPSLRPVHAILTELGVALVAPAVSDGEVQGALLVPGPIGGVPLDSGVVDAFTEAVRWIAPPLAHFAAHARMAERETSWFVERRALVGERDRERARARAATAVVRPTFVARSAAMQALLLDIERASPDSQPMLVVGRAGSGAERAARAVHAAGPHRDGPFVVRPAWRLRSSDLEPDGPAAGGTLLVRDVPALPASLLEPLAAAAKVASYRLVGTSRIDALDESLLAVFTGRIHVPSLVERREDIPELAVARLRDLAAAIGRPDLVLSPSAIDVLGRHAWPGNVIELDLVLSDAASRAKGSRIEAPDLRLIVAPASVGKKGKDPRPS